MAYSPSMERSEISDYNAELCEINADDLAEWHAFLDAEIAVVDKDATEIAELGQRLSDLSAEIDELKAMAEESEYDPDPVYPE